MIAWDWTSARKIPGQGVKQRVQVYVRFSCCISTVPNCTTHSHRSASRSEVTATCRAQRQPQSHAASHDVAVCRRRVTHRTGTPTRSRVDRWHKIKVGSHAPTVRAGRGSCASARCSPSTSRGRCMVHPRPAAASSPVTRPSQARFQLALPRRETLVAGVDLT